MSSVFISRDLSDKSAFRRKLEEKGHHVFAQSMLSYRAMDFELPPLADWLFFNSAASVRFFLEGIRGNIPQNYQLATLDYSAANTLLEVGLEAQFCGRGPLDEVADTFTALAQQQSSIFVQSRKSKQSIYHLVNQRIQAEELIVYEYLPRADLLVPPCDVYVFTSPLNVKNFFERYLFPNGSKVISTDPSTTESLRSYGISNAYQSEFNDEEGLAFIVRTLVS